MHHLRKLRETASVEALELLQLCVVALFAEVRGSLKI
jgi:hypothetical protein